MLRQNKKLLVFPVVTAVCSLGILLFFLPLLLAPVGLQDTGYFYSAPEHWRAIGAGLSRRCSPGLVVSPALEMVRKSIETDDPKEVMNYAKGILALNTAEEGDTEPLLLGLSLALLYFLSMFLTTFFNVGFYSEILNALNGRPVSILGGLRSAVARWQGILFWSLLAGAVGYFIRALERRLSLVGRWIAGLIGVGWSVACVFVAPVIVRENTNRNPLTFLKRSATMLRATWGEALAGYVGFGSLTMLVVLLPLGLFLLLGLGCVVATQTGHASLCALSPTVVCSALGLWLLAASVFLYVCAVVEKIYVGALYVYASEGVVPESFDEEVLNMAWKVK